MANLFVARMSSHVQECIRSFSQCKFSPIGCQFQGNQLEVEKYEVGNFHAEMMMKLLLDLQTENECCRKMQVVQGNLEKIIEKQEKEIQDLHLKQIEQSGKIEELLLRIKLLAEDKDEVEHSIKTMEKTIELLTKQQTEQCDSVENCQKTVTSVITSNNQLTKAVAEDKKILSDKIEKIELDLKNQLATFSSLEYVWKIDNFRKACHKARSGRQDHICSDHFYTKNGGYRMRLFLYPNGDLEGKGTYLSLFLQVIEGPNDAILRWPLQYRAHLFLMDQLTQTDHYVKILESDLINFKECFERPMDAENEGYGKSYFIRLDEIEPKYVVDDTMFVKLDLNVTT